MALSVRTHWLFSFREALLEEVIFFHLIKQLSSVLKHERLFLLNKTVRLDPILSEMNPPHNVYPYSYTIYFTR
jgi:hypothetical protein